MQNKESLYSKDWIAKGDNDLDAARILLEAKNLQSASFHIQQAIEKYLKGYLLSKGWKLRRIHELDGLLDEAAPHNPGFEKFRPLCELATEYYIEERYPLLVVSALNRDELESVLKQVEEFIRFIQEALKEKRGNDGE